MKDRLKLLGLWSCGAGDVQLMRFQTLRMQMFRRRHLEVADQVEDKDHGCWEMCRCLSDTDVNIRRLERLQVGSRSTLNATTSFSSSTRRHEPHARLTPRW